MPNARIIFSWFLYDKIDSTQYPLPRDTFSWIVEFHSKKLEEWHNLFKEEYEEYNHLYGDKQSNYIS
jgi:hypothetical protein